MARMQSTEATRIYSYGAHQRWVLDRVSRVALRLHDPRGALMKLRDSIIIAGAQTPDGRDLDETRRRVRAEVRTVAVEIGRPIEVYACARHGGCVVDVVEPDETV